ncbi:hypothetical protein PVAND_000491 [Polypedilum vanderplanki]|uniref:Uncharacterized protein n=1 Tax=Polypedilum vanderplanki TaxID=319348 RepID=A0A9J6BK98_POLVA|nr:hypothetical protein PVAND_000491 [Polypedilum vanderplanki]
MKAVSLLISSLCIAACFAQSTDKNLHRCLVPLKTEAGTITGKTYTSCFQNKKTIAECVVIISNSLENSFNGLSKCLGKMKNISPSKIQTISFDTKDYLMKLFETSNELCAPDGVINDKSEACLKNEYPNNYDSALNFILLKAQELGLSS